MEMDDAKDRLIGVLLVLLSGMAIAIVPTAAKLAFESGANTLTVVTLRCPVGMALIAPELRSPRWLPWRFAL